LDNAKLNITAVVELLLAVLITQVDGLRTLLGTVRLTLSQFGLALAPAVTLVLLWEIGKLIARRQTGAPTIAPAA
jgi:Ca2+-transporting ATPase